MNDIALDCPHCGQRLEGEGVMRGQKIQCPACHGEVIVPGSAKAMRIPSPTAVAEEQIFALRPTAKSFLGRIILGIILAPVVLGIVILLYVWYRVASVRYRLTNQRLFVQRGLIAKHVEEIELFRVKDVTVQQGVVERVLRFGTITVLSSDDTNPQLNLTGISHPIEVKEKLRQAFRAARAREGMRTGEYIPS